MKNRPDLQTLLEELLGSDHVYFQPPSTVQLKYPAIIYNRNDINNTFADDSVYKQSFEYKLTVIDKNPDSEIVKKVSALPKCRFDRHFNSNNLNHDVFVLYY